MHRCQIHKICSEIRMNDDIKAWMSHFVIPMKWLDTLLMWFICTILAKFIQHLKKCKHIWGMVVPIWHMFSRPNDKDDFRKENGYISFRCRRLMRFFNASQRNHTVYKILLFKWDFIEWHNNSNYWFILWEIIFCLLIYESLMNFFIIYKIWICFVYRNVNFNNWIWMRPMTVHVSRSMLSIGYGELA